MTETVALRKIPERIRDGESLMKSIFPANITPELPAERMKILCVRLLSSAGIRRYRKPYDCMEIGGLTKLLSSCSGRKHFLILVS